MPLAQIAGFPGAGKTRLCQILRATYGSRLTVVDTDDVLGAVQSEIDRILRTSYAPIVAVGTFGLEPAIVAKAESEYPVFSSHFYWWLDVPLEVCMERALRRQIHACHENFDGFMELQRNKSTTEISEWLNEYMNSKYRGEQWNDLKSIFLSQTNSEGQLLFDPVSEEQILTALSHAVPNHPSLSKL